MKKKTLKGYKKKPELGYSFKRTKKNLAGNKLLNIKKDVAKYEKLLQSAPLEMKKYYRDKMFKSANDLVKQRDIYNTEANKELIKSKGIKLKDLQKLTDDQSSIVDQLKRRLSDYSLGDSLYTEFYHEEGFLSADTDSIVAFAVMRGLI